MIKTVKITRANANSVFEFALIEFSFDQEIGQAHFEGVFHQGKRHPQAVNHFEVLERQRGF